MNMDLDMACIGNLMLKTNILCMILILHLAYSAVNISTLPPSQSYGGFLPRYAAYHLIHMAPHRARHLHLPPRLDDAGMTTLIPASPIITCKCLANTETLKDKVNHQ